MNDTTKPNKALNILLWIAQVAMGAFFIMVGATKSFQSIEAEKDLIKTYIDEAIANAQLGKEIKPKPKPLIIPVELQKALKNDQELQMKFEAFNLTRKRDCVEFVGAPKREATRLAKLEKLIPMILDGISPGDKYRK